MREIIFKRGRDPKISMDTGIVKNIRGWLNILKPEDSSYCIMQGDTENGFVIDVEGNIVLDDYEIKELFKVKFGIVTGRITILSELSKEELYSRVRKFYNDVLDNCLGMTNEEQQVFLYGEANRAIETQSGTIILGLGQDNIKISEDYIRSLPVNLPPDDKIKELVNHILSGKEKWNLEYGYHAVDKEYSVEMHQYAKAIGKLLSATTKP
jgi:hypothetical protein